MAEVNNNQFFQDLKKSLDQALEFTKGDDKTKVRIEKVTISDEDYKSMTEEVDEMIRNANKNGKALSRSEARRKILQQRKDRGDKNEHNSKD